MEDFIKGEIIEALKAAGIVKTDQESDLTINTMSYPRTLRNLSNFTESKVAKMR